MRTVLSSLPLLAIAALLAGLAPAHAEPRGPGADTVRVATFNASLNRSAEGELVRDLSTPNNAQARNVAETIQLTRPDILLINEFDYDADHRAMALFRYNYLEVGQRGAEPIDYPYAYTAPSNTGIPSGHDLNNDGAVGGPDDAYGFGAFPGQYGMVIYSRYPIATQEVRTFQTFAWADMPGNLMPADFYGPEASAAMRLSSKSHWDVPVQVGGRRLHVLASHPTPPVFDGPEDRNGRRNHDEIRFWADYVGAPRRSAYIYDDAGVHGGLKPGERFVIVGDLNSDPNDGDSVEGSIEALLDHPRIHDPLPTSEGAIEQATLQGGVNDEHTGDPALDTADFAEPPGNVRVDYVLPSRGLPVEGSGVFWPTTDDLLFRLTGTYPFPTSDHRLVWVDLRVPGGR